MQSAQMPLRSFHLLALVFFACLSGCLTPPPTKTISPDERLESLLTQLRDVRGGEFDGGSEHGGATPREAQLIRRIHELTLTFPRHVPILVASASLAYENNDSVRAQKYLDQALALEPSNAVATLLRVRIAAEAGNLPYARRKLGEQIDLAPDDPSLREALSGIHYLAGDYEDALEELDIADRLRDDDENRSVTQYHRGLIAEAQGDVEAAKEHYRQSQEQDPEYQPAARRLRWLEASAAPEE